MTVAKVSLEARDVAIEFNDSCNCCCWSWRKTSPLTPLYVNSNGDVVKFDFKKVANEHAALEKSVDNLKRCISHLAEQHNKEQKQISEMIEQIEQLRNNGHINTDILRRIKYTIEHWLKKRGV